MSPKTVLILLTAVNLVGYVDRSLIAAVIPAIQNDLHLSYTEAGRIISAFMLGYFATSPLFGYLADRFSRVKLISVGTVLWSIATVVSGFGANALQIFTARLFVGLGEASTVSSGQAVLADYFPRGKRNQVIAVFTMAIPLGFALGYGLGAILEPRFGWRSSFFIAAIPGLVLAVIIALFVKEPKRGILERMSFAERPAGFFQDIKVLLKNRVFMKSVYGYTAYTFCVGGFASWAPTYLVKVRDIPLSQANTYFFLTTVITAVVGSIAGGWLAAHFAERKKNGDMWFVSVTTLISIPFAYAAFLCEKPQGFITCMAIAEFFLFLAQPAINVIIMENVSPFLRSTALTFSVFIIHLLGDFPSPQIVGVLADLFRLQVAVLILPTVLFFAAWFYWDIYKNPTGRGKKGFFLKKLPNL